MRGILSEIGGKNKRRLMAVIVILLGGFVLVNLLAYRHARLMMHFNAGPNRTLEPERLTWVQKATVALRGVEIPRPRTTRSLHELGSSARAVQISGPNHISLGAWYCPVAGAEFLAVLFHGYAGEKSGTLGEAKAFLEMGCSVLLVDFRGSGDSSESYTTIGYDEAEDVASALAYARANLPEPRRLLYGQSMGAAAVFCAVQRYPIHPDAIIAEAVFDRLLNTVRNRFRAMGMPTFPGAELLLFWGGQQAGFNGFNHNPADYAAAIRCPVLFLQGTADSRARPEEGRRVFRAVTAPKQFQDFSGVGHQSTLAASPEKWKQAVRAFVESLASHAIQPSSAAAVVCKGVLAGP